MQSVSEDGNVNTAKLMMTSKTSGYCLNAYSNHSNLKIKHFAPGIKPGQPTHSTLLCSIARLYTCGHHISILKSLKLMIDCSTVIGSVYFTI